MEIEVDNSMRLLSDRRKSPTPILSRFTLWGGHRKTTRRGVDKERHLFVDLYSTRLLLAVISLLCLSCLDASLTLILIQKGSVVEANPLMAYFLNLGVLPFTMIKFSITASALTVLVLCKNLKITRYSLPFAINVYILIIIYELYLFSL